MDPFFGITTLGYSGPALNLQKNYINRVYEVLIGKSYSKRTQTLNTWIEWICPNEKRERLL